jgi:hypothetical protein
MSNADQAIWSHAAATSLALSIPSLALGGTQDDEAFITAILPHIQQVRKW